MVKNISILILLLSLFSCASYNGKGEELLGKYTYKDEFVSGELILEENNVFHFKYFTSLGLIQSRGQWNMSANDKRIVLKSDEEFKTDYIIVKEINTNEAHIELYDSVSALPDNFKVKVNGHTYFTKNGVVELNENYEFNEIEVFYPGLTDGSKKYSVQNKGANTFIIHIFPWNFSKIYFDKSFRKGRNFIVIDTDRYVKS